MPPPLGRSEGPTAGPDVGPDGVAALAEPGAPSGSAVPPGPDEGELPPSLRDPGVSSGGATAEPTSSLPAGGAGIAACSLERSRSRGAARTKPTAASTASRPSTGAAMREKRLPTIVPSARQRLTLMLDGVFGLHDPSARIPCIISAFVGAWETQPSRPEPPSPGARERPLLLNMTYASSASEASSRTAGTSSRSSASG
jgi:hypothetical protein